MKRAITAYDKPHERFHRLNLIEKHEFYSKLMDVYKLDGLKEGNESIFSKMDDSKSIILKTKRPVLLVSSSSWTEDEDFHILIDAFESNLIIIGYFFLLNDPIK